MYLAWAQLGVSMITRSMLVLSAGLLAAVVPLAGAAQAQSIFLLDEDQPATTDTPSESGQDGDAAATAPAPAEPAPEDSSIFMNTNPSTVPDTYVPPVSQGNGGGSGGGGIIAPEIGGGGRAAVQTLNDVEGFGFPLPSTEELLRPERIGMTTPEYNKRLADIEAAAVKNPEAGIGDPVFEFEMLRTGEKISQTYGRQIGERCAMPAYTISIMPGDWSPRSRDGLQQQALGQLSAAITSACGDQATKQKIGSVAPMMMVQNQIGGGMPQVVFEGGVMMLRGDFTKTSEGINAAALQSQLNTALVAADKYMKPLLEQAETYSKDFGE